jgi:carboxypeptidase T
MVCVASSGLRIKGAIMRRWLTGALAAGLICTSAYATEVLRIENNPANARIVQEMGLDYLSRTPEHIDILWDEAAQEMLGSEGFFRSRVMDGSAVVERDVEAQFSRVKTSDDLGVYHTFAEVEQELRDAAEQYPELCRLTVAGKSWEDRPIYALEMGKGSKDGKPAFLVVGSHHAREWISVEVPMALVKDLLEAYATDAEAKDILDNVTIVVVPVMNPDGTVYSHQEYSMWRKNRRKNENGSYGVDNNRNYGYKWGVSGASSYPGSDTYKGPDAMSEPENLTIKSLEEKYHFTGSVSYHSYGNLVLWPWSYTDRIQCKDNEVLKKHGTAMAKIMGYRPIQSADLYPAAGDTDDFLYGNYGVMSFTIELARGGFVPRESEVPKITSDGVKALRYLFVNARDPFKEVRAEATYPVKGVLEKLVREMVRGGTLQERASLYQKLASYSDDLVQQAMDESDLSQMSRIRIKKEMSQLNSFQSME